MYYYYPIIIIVEVEGYFVFLAHPTEFKMGSHEGSIPRGEPDATGSHGERLEGAGTPRETETRVHIKGSRKYGIRSASVNPIY